MTDTVQAPPQKKSPLEDVVKYTANDSIVFLSNNQAYMYGQGVVTYQDIELDADEIRMNMDSSTVFAIGRPDTTGEIVGNPIFKDKSGEYESATMKYNFKSADIHGHRMSYISRLSNKNPLLYFFLYCHLSDNLLLVE